MKGEVGSPFQFTYDDTMGTFQPALSAADLPRLQSALKGAVAVVGAIDIWIERIDRKQIGARAGLTIQEFLTLRKTLKKLRGALAG